jgi:hypothetical protein
MPAYVIAETDVHDPEQYERYQAASPGAIAAGGGRFMARGGELVVLEGDWRPTRLVLRIGRRVPIGCPATTHQPTAPTKKTCKCRRFCEAAEGIRTLDLLHGKQELAIAHRLEIPANRNFLPDSAWGGSPEIA